MSLRSRYRITEAHAMHVMCHCSMTVKHSSSDVAAAHEYITNKYYRTCGVQLAVRTSDRSLRARCSCAM